MKIKSIYYHYFFYCLLFFAFTNCVQEEIVSEVVSQKSQLDLSNYKISMSSYEHVKNVNTSFNNTTTKLLKLKENISSERINSSNYNFYIEEDQVQIIEAVDYVSYTFLVYRDYETPNILENYMYVDYDDGSYDQYLLSHSYSLDEEGNYILGNSQEISVINDSSLMLSRAGCVTELVDIFEGTIYTSVQCSGVPGGHEVGDDDCQCGQPSANCNVAYILESTGNIYIYEENCSGGDNSDTGTGNPNNPNSTGTGGGIGGNGFIWKPVKSKPVNEQFKGMLNMQDITLDRANWIDNSSNVFKVFSLMQLMKENMNSDGNLNQNLYITTLEILDIMVANPDLSFQQVVLDYINQHSEFELEFGNDVTADVNFFELSSISEMDDFLNDFNNSFQFSIGESYTENIFGQDLKLTRFKGEFPSTIFPVYLNIDVKSELDDIDTITIDEFNLDTVTSFDSGMTTFVDWVQETYEVTSEGETFVEVTVYGHFDLGFKFFGEIFIVTESWTIQVVFNKKTGEAIDMNAILN